MSTRSALYRLRRFVAVTATVAAATGSLVVATGAGVAHADEGTGVTNTLTPRIVNGSPAPTPPVASGLPAVLDEVTPPTEPTSSPDSASLALASGTDLSYRCGGSSSVGTIGVPALVGSCLFTIVPTAAPTGTGTLSLHVIVTPTSTFYNQVVGIGYRGYNLGMKLDGALGSPVDMTLSLYNVNLSSSFTLCSGTANVAYSVPALGSRVESMEASIGSGTLASWDTAYVSAQYWYGMTANSAYVDFSGGCGGVKHIYISLPSNLYRISGWYNSYTFSFTGPPSWIDIKIDETVYHQQVFTLQHNSSNMSGSVNLGAYGNLSFTNAPRYYYAKLVKDGSNDLSTFYANASSAPGSGTNIYYTANIAGIAIHVDVRAINSVTFSMDMPNKAFYGDITFKNQNGYSDSYATGSWKSVSYNVSFSGSGIGHIYLYVNASPYIDFEANLRPCGSGCGSVSANVDASWFGLSVGTGFSISRNSSGTYHLHVPWVLGPDYDVSEGGCAYWAYGIFWECSLYS